MSGVPENLPIVYAPDASGVLRHVDDVPNGKACGCRCPAHGCGQPLVAKNGGRVRTHHFAHERGTCAWAAESVIAALAERVLGRSGRAAFPSLAFEDVFKGCEVELSPARTLPVATASSEFVAGRGAPEVVATCRSAAGEEKRFAFVFCLVHPLEGRHVEAFRAAGLDAVEVNLRAALNAAKRAEGRHFDRADLLLRFQDEGFIERAMLDRAFPYRSWARNGRREEAEAASLARLEERHSAEKAECERREAEERERRAREARERERAEAERSFMEGMVADPRKPAVDSSGRRWYKCDVCGKVAAEGEFSDIRGWVEDVNLAICKECR